MLDAPGAVPGLVMAGALIALSVLFGLRQWLDRRRRDPDLGDEDARYFARQDARRLGGSTLMLLIAASMVLGFWIDPRADREQARLWGLTWLGICLLVLALLLVGLIDWIAIRAYATRHRRALAAERLEILEEERRRLGDLRRSRPAPDDGNGSRLGDPPPNTPRR